VANAAATDLRGGNTNTNDLYDFVGKHTLSIGSTGSSLRCARPAHRPGQQHTAGDAERKWQFRNDFTWFRDRHNLKFGTNYIHTELGGYFYFGAFGY
jgi:hypothetical protein